MAQAKPNTSTRRAFLSTAGAAAAATVAPAALAITDRDPIFAAIEAHRAAAAVVYAVNEVHTGLEIELPAERRCSHVTVWGEKTVTTDDPRWIDCERAAMRAWDAQDDAAVALLHARPTTMAGVKALLDYAVEANVDGQGWPGELLMNDGKTRSWHHILVENVAAAIPQCA